MLAWLSGKKTYLGTIAAGILGLLWSMGYVSDEVAGVLGSIIGTWTGVAIRSAIAKTQTGTK